MSKIDDCLEAIIIKLAPIMKLDNTKQVFIREVLADYITDDMVEVTPKDDGDGHIYLIPKVMEEDYNRDAEEAERTEDYDYFVATYDMYRLPGAISTGPKLYTPKTSLHNNGMYNA